MPEPSLHPDGHRAVASSKTGAMLFQGYRVRHAAKPGEAHPPVGIIAAITPDGDRVAVTWPSGDTTWHRGCNLIRWGSVSLNEQHPETRKGYPAPPSPPLTPAVFDEQCWVELTRSQVVDLLSLVQDRLAQVEGRLRPEQDPPDELRARRTELLVLKGMLLLGRDDPGATR